MIAIIESLLIALAICMDSFAIGLSYGFKGIIVSKKPIIIINLITIVSLVASMYLGNIATQFLNDKLASLISFLIFISLGLFIIVQGYINYLIKKSKAIMIIVLSILNCLALEL